VFLGMPTAFGVIPWQHLKAHREGASATKNLQKNFMAAVLGEENNKPSAYSILKGFTEELEESIFQHLKGQGWGKYILGRAQEESGW